jgi:hypothetical protein
MSKEILKSIDKTISLLANANKLGNEVRAALEQARNDVERSEKWEPTHGLWYVTGEFLVTKPENQLVPFEAIRTFTTEAEATEAARLMRQHATILKYRSMWIAENAGVHEFNYCVYKDSEGWNGLELPAVRSYYGLIPMPEACADQLVDDLNNGRVEL